MSDNSSKTTNRTFKKRAHRPWQTELLETTIENATIASDDAEEITLDLDINITSSEDLDSFYPDFDFTQALDAATTNKQIIETTPLQVSAENVELQQQLLQTKQQQQQIMREINDKSSSQILLGGF